MHVKSKKEKGPEIGDQNSLLYTHLQICTSMLQLINAHTVLCNSSEFISELEGVIIDSSGNLDPLIDKAEITSEIIK